LHLNGILLVVKAVDKELYKTVLEVGAPGAVGYEAGAKHAQSKFGVKWAVIVVLAPLKKVPKLIL